MCIDAKWDSCYASHQLKKHEHNLPTRDLEGGNYGIFFYNLEALSYGVTCEIYTSPKSLKYSF